MWTYTAERVVRATLASVEAAIAPIVHRLWDTRARAVIMPATAGRIDAIVSEPGTTEADVWLTWHLEPAGRWTRVRLLLDELDPGPDPTAGLEQILDLLERQAGVVRQA